MSSVAITDHGNLYGAVEFYKKAKAAGIKPIIGCELYVAKRNHLDKTANVDDERYHLVVLAKNQTGYKNLVKLVSKAHLDGFYYKPRVDKELLRKHSEGLIALSGCLGGEISQTLLNKGIEAAEKVAYEYQEIFGKENYFLELQQHPNIEEQNIVNPLIIELARKTKIPLVGTQDSHYLRPDDAHAHDVLLAVQTNNRTDDKDRLTMKIDDFSITSPEETYKKFKLVNGLEEKGLNEIFENTQLIANQCNLEIELGKIQLPHFEIPVGYKDPDEYLKYLCYEGLKNKTLTATKEQIEERLSYELSVIKQTGFATYFLIVQDLVNWAKNEGIIVGPGRGSAAGSLAAYLLNITGVDSLKYGLIFERFLNPARISMPDIDLDFDDARRHEVLDYVAKKYGYDHVAQIITFGTMASRGAIRDAGRALGFSYDFCDKIAKVIPFNFNLKKALESVPELKEAYASDAQAKNLIDSAMKLEGVARHASTHACGVVITKEPLIEQVPLQRANEDREGNNVITQYEMRAIEDLGLLKMDFLGLANLTIIENSLKLIDKIHDIKINIEEIPLDDKETFQLLREAKTTGVFQLECLPGDTRISNTTIEKLYSNKNNKNSLRSVYLDSGTLHNNKIINVVKSGKKKVFMVVAENGRIIKASGNHRFMTQNGWRKLSELKINEDYLLYKQKAKFISLIKCKNCGKEREVFSENLKKHHGFCYKCSAVYFKNPSKLESKTAISKAMLDFYKNGGKSWNDGLTKKNNKILAKTGKKISKSLTGITLEMKYGKAKAEEIRKRFSERFTGQGNPMFGKKSPHRKGGLRNDLGHYVRSNWEADFARILKLHKIEYEYEPKTFGLVDDNGEKLSYTPDFYTPHNNTFYEIKGWMHELDSKKIELFQKQYSEYKFILINTTKFAELAMEYKNLIKWECPRIPNQLTYTKIKEIRYLGEKMTYDIIMERPGNNFIANSFVVHNSSGMKRYLKELKPTEFEDICVMISLYRPGPMELIPEFIARKHGKRKVDYLHPKLESILKETYGIMIYQEQLIKAVQALAGFTLAEADVLRKAVGKKIRKLLMEQEVKFMEGALKNDTPPEIAKKFWALIEPFNRYGFNKSHGIAYAMISYQTAYLKAHYPVEFMAALMNSHSGDVEKIAFLIDEGTAMNISVMPPDINESFALFSAIPNSAGEETKIRFGLLSIKNVGENIVKAIIEEREKNGKFISLEDFITRVQHKDLNKKSLESLIKCGALDSLGERNTFLYNLEDLLLYAREFQKHKSFGQVSLFGQTEIQLPPLRLKEAPALSKWEKANWEKELLGLFVSEHPMKDYQMKLKLEHGVSEIKEIISKIGQNVKIGGLLTKIQRVLTRNNQPMIFSQIEDTNSKVELIVFNDLIQKNPALWQENNIVVVSGRVNEKDGVPKIICQEATPVATLS